MSVWHLNAHYCAVGLMPYIWSGLRVIGPSVNLFSRLRPSMSSEIAWNLLIITKHQRHPPCRLSRAAQVKKVPVHVNDRSARAAIRAIADHSAVHSCTCPR